MRVLVLGSTGFLGRHITEHLRALSGVRVLHAGRSPGADLRVDLTTTTVPALAADLRALAPDAVVNCAGAVGGGPLLLAETNARGPAVLCEALTAADIPVRLVHLGSAGEYGTTAGQQPQPLGEDSATCPQGAYGATKLAGSLTVAEAELDAVVLRVFNPLGPGSPGTSLPGRLADELLRAGPDGTVRVGDLSAYRDFVDARDVARAAALATTTPGPLPRVLNIAGGSATRVREVAEGLARISGFHGRIDENGTGSRRSSAISWQQADITAAATALGWHPERTLATSLADLWNARTGTPPAPTPAPV
ncbi:NAD(P)-dependent oxidoreductase [Streptomyces sp. AK08-02]|uniref:NAD-dependent epimerase/dehydratase family protein n=1 Tax=Streptomyces sp. AK08-02 TaxID=3028654 RepID=UPI0029A1EE2C|nr:NAD(P)-dependent oxidoreductase [Streptomyces sp. AK08-02]MDX3749665.1 NAD(P)-dependent oxidoreductase [Streptomyces sp. AK08-02]